MEDQYVVYRFYSVAGVLLYVGMTMNLKQRVSLHRRAPWFPQVARVESEPVGSYDEARARERELIRSGLPLFNVNGIPNCKCPTCGLPVSIAEKRRMHRRARA